MKRKKDESANLGTGLTTPPTGGSIQVGTIVAYYGTTAPETWLLCNGDAIPSQYTTLIGMIGSNTPDLSARVLMGVGTGTDGNDFSHTVSLGESAGHYKVTLTVNEMPCHQHFGFGESSESNWGTGNSTNKGYTGTGDNDKDNYLYGSTWTGGTPGDQIATSNGSVTGTSKGDTTAHTNIQPFFGINYIIYAGTD